MGMNGGASQTAARGLRGWIIGAAGTVATVLVGATAFGALGGDGDRRGEVVRVIDGDTLVAIVDGEETTIRLLTFDTPETKNPDEPVQCLGPEATEFLTERLPAGTPIELEYDEERLDRYDRTLAGVYESESLINAEIAEAGLGVPVYFAPNDRFLREVEEASERAQENGAGLFSDEIECTLPGTSRPRAPRWCSVRRGGGRSGRRARRRACSRTWTSSSPRSTPTACPSSGMP